MSSLDLNNLSIEELQKIKKENKSKLKKEFTEFKQQKEKQKLIDEIKEIENKRKKITKAKTIKPKTKTKKIKSFDDYFQECIKNKSIPKDTPKYLRKALERAIKEYEQGIVLEKSALGNFAEKYVIKGKPGISPKQFFQEKAQQVKQFFKKSKYKNQDDFGLFDGATKARREVDLVCTSKRIFSFSVIY